MTALMEMLEIELSNLKMLQHDIKSDNTQPAKGTVFTKEENGKPYYWSNTKTEDKREQKYLGDRFSKKLHQFSRAIFKYKLIHIIDHDIRTLNQILAKYQSYDKSSVIASLSPALWDVPFDAEFSTVMKRLYAWANADYEKNSKPFGDRVIRAKDGRRVRSKSECVVYNALLDAGIPFRYDSVIELRRLRTDGTVEIYYESPDFLIMCPDGSQIIIEHAGRLTSMQYAETLARKLQMYQLNNYSLGYTLFVTSDDVTGGIDSEEIDKIIKIIRARFPYM